MLHARTMDIKGSQKLTELKTAQALYILVSKAFSDHGELVFLVAAQVTDGVSISNNDVEIFHRSRFPSIFQEIARFP